MDDFTYDVVISGMENIPLRTNKQGAKALMTAFDKGEQACDILLKAMSEGIEYNNNLVTIKRAEQPAIANPVEKP